MMNQFEMVPTSQLFVDTLYQRELRPTRVKRLDKKWNDKATMPLLVSKRGDGRYSVVDGQHRLERYKMRNISSVCCKVETGMSIEEEAALFQEVNQGVNKPTPIEIFKASLAAKDEIYLRIEEIVYANGYDFPFVSPSLNAPKVRSGGNQISAVNTLKRIAYDRNKTDGFQNLDETLRYIKNAWGNDKDAISGQMLSGVSRFLLGASKISHFDKKRLIEVLSKTPAITIIREGRRLKVMYDGEMETNIAIAITEIYNTRLRSDKLNVADILNTDQYNFVKRDDED